MVHGDLKGVRFQEPVLLSIFQRISCVKANILIDQTGHARLADFGLLTIISEATDLVSSSSLMQGGTIRWMGPELLNPQRFGFENSRPTRHSDCYALGIVVYEVLSERIPFHQDADFVVVGYVVEGKRPGRPQGIEGMWFTDDVWGVLERCWAPQPDSRPSIKDILQCLEKVSRSWAALPPRMVTRAQTMGSPTRNSGSSTEGSTNGGEASSLSQADPSQSSQMLRPKGDLDENST